jgi:D-amino-acid oxidase
VSVVAAEPPARTTSAVAAALWYPYRAFPASEVTRWSGHTYRALRELSGTPGSGVRMRWGRELLRVVAGDPWWRPAVPALDRLDPGELPDGYRDGWRLAVPVVDMPVHLAWLQERLAGHGVGIRIQRLTALAELAGTADVVVNCTGLGAGHLLGDGEVTPVRGQIVVVEQFGLSEWLLDQQDEASLTYLVPREETVVLGGTAEEDSDHVEPSAAVAEQIRRRCAGLVPGAGRARIVAHRVGLRPVRPAVRLELDTAERDVPVVHCYGHGGAGVTLSYGCAADVLKLVDSLA